jgi:hypothetical protein
MSPRLLTLFCLVAAVAGFECAHFLKRGAGQGSDSEALASQAAPPSGVAPVSPEEGKVLAGFGAPKIRERLQSLRTIMNAVEGAAPSDKKLVLMDAINRMDSAALVQLLGEIADDASFFRTFSPEFEHAARRLSEIEPEKAAELWLSRRGALLGGSPLLLPWASRNPGAFASWSLGLPQDAQRALGSVLGDLARKNPQQFAELAPQLATSPAGAAGARAAIQGFLEKSKAEKQDATKTTDAALAFAKGLPEGAMRSAALVEAAQNADMKKLNLVANEELRDALAALGPLESRTVAQKFADAADKLPQGALRESAFAAQISAAAQKDPKSAAKKVEALSGSADYPAAVRGFVDATAAKDPAAAADWALSIGPQGGQRTAALEKAAAEYFRQKPDEARKWVTNAPLSAEEYFLLTGFRR